MDQAGNDRTAIQGWKGTRVVLRLPVLILCLLTALPAQDKTWTVSPAFDSKDAPTNRSLPGLHGGFRQQILVAQTRMASLKGSKLTGFWFRRDPAVVTAMRGGSVQMTVTAASGPAALGDVVETFANNHRSTPSKVFAGVVSVPDAPAIASGYQPWSTQQSVRITFDTPFAYAGGTLVLDIVGLPIANKEPQFWRVASEDDNGGGTTESIGTSCSAYRNNLGLTTRGHAESLRVGSSSHVVCVGPPGASVMLFASTRRYSPPVDLTALGATGCAQHVPIDIPLPIARYLGPFPVAQIGHYDLGFHIPNVSILMGARIYYQAADFETALPRKEWTNPMGLTTSNAVALTISSKAPVLGLATVTSLPVTDPKQALPTTGTVDVGTAPVLRLLYR